MPLIEDAIKACKATPDSRYSYQGSEFECLQFNIVESALLRQAMYSDIPEIFSGRTGVINDAINGVKQRREYFEGYQLMSEVNGGRSKFDCGFKPQKDRHRLNYKTMVTHFAHIDAEQCLKALLGTVKQTAWVQTMPTNQQVFGNAQFTQEWMARILRDGRDQVARHMVWGDRRNGSQLPIFDGRMKRFYHATQGLFYHTKKLVFPTIGGTNFIAAIQGGKEHFSSRAGLGSQAATIQDFVNWVNTILFQDGSTVGASHLVRPLQQMYNATYDGANTVYISSTDPQRIIDLKVLVMDAASVDWGCDYPGGGVQSITTTEIENAMSWVEKPGIFEYAEVTDLNAIDYMADLYKFMVDHYATLVDLASTAVEVYVNPQWLEYAKIQQARATSTYLPFQIGANIPDFGVNFVPHRQLINRNEFWADVPGNAVFLTNDVADLNNVRTWFSDDKQMPQFLMEMFANVDYSDYGLVVTNIAGSPAAETFGPMADEDALNIPCLCTEVERECLGRVTTCGATADFSLAFTADDGVGQEGQWVLGFTNASTGEAPITYAWEITFDDGALAATNTSATPTAINNIPPGTEVIVILTITDDSGCEDTATVSLRAPAEPSEVAE